MLKKKCNELKFEDEPIWKWCHCKRDLHVNALRTWYYISYDYSNTTQRIMSNNYESFHTEGKYMYTVPCCVCHASSCKFICASRHWVFCHQGKNFIHILCLKEEFVSFNISHLFRKCLLNWLLNLILLGYCSWFL